MQLTLLILSAIGFFKSIDKKIKGLLVNNKDRFQRDTLGGDINIIIIQNALPSDNVARLMQDDEFDPIYNNEPENLEPSNNEWFDNEFKENDLMYDSDPQEFDIDDNEWNDDFMIDQ